MLPVFGKTPARGLGSSNLQPKRAPQRLCSRMDACLKPTTLKIQLQDRSSPVRPSFAPELIVIALLFHKAFSSKLAIVQVVLATP